jgi:uncharacterized membrane protein
MSSQVHRHRRHRFLPHRVVWARPRLFASAALAIVCTAVLGAVTAWRPATRTLVGWDAGVTMYLVLVFEMMARSTLPDIRRRASREDAGQFAILVLAVAAGLASLGAILVQLTSNRGDREPLQLALVVVTILLSWTFIHVMFALHYAHEFYGEDAGPAGGLTFPGGGDRLDYWDFVYFAFVIGMTSQVSDVAVTSREIRRTVIAHGIVSFVFNVALLALMINIASGVLTRPG